MDTHITKMIGIADIASILNAISGLFAIISSMYHDSLLCAFFLLLSVFFDAIDGPLARKYPTSTDDIFGETIDSLADVISFGVTPAIILFVLYDNILMIIPSILILSCGILRLSRYNTIIKHQTQPTISFIGIPIPITSFLLAQLLISNVLNVYLVIVIMSIIALLMVSNFNYPKIKNKFIIIFVSVIILLSLIIPINMFLFKIPSYLVIFFILIYVLAPFIYNK